MAICPGDAYRAHAAQQAYALGGIAKASEGISYAVEGAGLIVGLVRGIVRDLIAQFVGTLAARLPCHPERSEGSAPEGRIGRQPRRSALRPAARPPISPRSPLRATTCSRTPVGMSKRMA